MVAFTGGEPFLLGKNLSKLVALAKGRGFVTRVVTSAYFGRDRDRARVVIEEVRNAGLDELSISWDDYHEQFVSFECIRTVYWLAKSIGMTVAVNVVQARNSRWTANRVKQELGVHAESEDIVTESPLNLTGSAREKLAEAGHRDRRFLGPCPYVMTGPTLSAKNKLLACCGVIPDTPHLVLQDNFDPSMLKEAISRGQRSPLLTWLYLRGPYAIMEWIGTRFDIPVPMREEIGGNCEACDRLFSHPILPSLLPQVLEEKAREIWDEFELLRSIGFASPRGVLELWAESGMILDLTPATPKPMGKITVL